jgi:hypothetical protein
MIKYFYYLAILCAAISLIGSLSEGALLRSAMHVLALVLFFIAIAKEREL